MTYTTMASLTKIVGAHALKVGWEGRMIRVNNHEYRNTSVSGVATSPLDPARPLWRAHLVTAPGAGIIAVQISSSTSDPAYCATPCVLSFTSDQMLGLERVYELRSAQSAQGPWQLVTGNISVSQYQFTTLTVPDAKGPQDIPVKIGSRGHFRLMARNCDFVPIRLELPAKGETAGTVFEGQTSLKLGTHCRSDREYDNYTLREYLTYRLFNLVTPLSFRARLARATYVDAKTKKTISNRYAILVEHENDVARRFGGRIVELQRIQFNDLVPGPEPGGLRRGGLVNNLGLL